MANPVHLRLVLEFEQPGTSAPRGSVTPPGGPPIPFDGWMQLSSVLAEVQRRRATSCDRASGR